MKAEINKCEQTKHMSVALYFGKLKVLWDDLANHEPLISCTCGNCTCGVGKQHETRRENARLQQFLLGLCPEYYSTVRSNILSQDPLPSLNKAYQQVSQDERVRGISQVRDEKPEVAGFAVRMGSKPKPRLSRAEKAALTCTYCHKTRHDTTSCFELHGIPTWYKETFGTPSADTKGAIIGRSVSSTVGRGKGVVAAHATSMNCRTTPPQVVHTQQPTSFTTEQWQSLISAFGTPSFPSNRLNGEWIIDTSCSHHVTGNISCLTDIKEVLPLPVGLLDGQHVMAVKEGVVRLTDTITLHNILIVPKLNCNLISVSQLSDDLKCCLITNSSICAIQDLQMREVIGTGERRDGLYYLCEGPKFQEVLAVSIASSSSLELWHIRLGHPSEKVVKWLPFFSDTTCSLNKDCEVCHRAKHSRSSFP